jgi:plastocyanin
MRSLLLHVLVGAALLGLATAAWLSGSTVQACPPGSYAQGAYGGGAYGAAGAYGAMPVRPVTGMAVGIYDDYFQPQRMNVPVGATVRWVNYGRHTHTVTADDNSWDSGDIRPGQSYVVTFRQPGTIYYHCHHHMQQKMVGVIVVGGGAGGGYGNGGGRATGAGSSGY